MAVFVSRSAMASSLSSRSKPPGTPVHSVSKCAICASSRRARQTCRQYWTKTGNAPRTIQSERMLDTTSRHTCACASVSSAGGFAGICLPTSTTTAKPAPDFRPRCRIRRSIPDFMIFSEDALPHRWSPLMPARFLPLPPAWSHRGADIRLMHRMAFRVRTLEIGNDARQEMVVLLPRQLGIKTRMAILAPQMSMRAFASSMLTSCAARVNRSTAH